MSPAQQPVFQALIVPHRSLTRKAALIIVGVLFGLSVAVALRFWLWGAWPVAAFSLLDVPLLVVLLAINQGQARASELIMLDADQLTVIRTDPAGRRKQEMLPAAWLRVDLEATNGIPRIVARSHGRGCEVGSFLHEFEKISLFEALQTAVYHAKNPRFDNPLLRED